MLYNPILPTLNQDDTNQRYAGTYVDYAGEILYVRHIVPGRKPVASVCNEEGMDYNIDPWDWKALDTRRPKAGWYTYKDEHGNTVCFFFRLSNRKQFHRGLNDDNTVIWYPYPDGQGAVSTYKNFRLALDAEPVKKKRGTSAELVESLAQANSYYAILQRYLCATRSRFVRGGVDLHYKAELIAQYTKDKWTMLNPNFVDEVRESIIDFNYEGMDVDKNLMDYLPDEPDNLKVKLLKKINPARFEGAVPRRPPDRVNWGDIVAGLEVAPPVRMPHPALDNFDQWWAEPVGEDEPGENPL